MVSLSIYYCDGLLTCITHDYYLRNYDVMGAFRLAILAAGLQFAIELYNRYNPRDGKWLQISSMSVPRTHFSLITMPNCLVAVGGKHNRVALNTAEKYDFASNEWSPISTLPHTLFSHAGCAHGSKVCSIWAITFQSVVLFLSPCFVITTTITIIITTITTIIIIMIIIIIIMKYCNEKQ